MRHLSNTDLSVDLLDPATDHARLGPRFCAGGYVWQIHDRRAGPLLTGPEWPNPAPAPANGQGLPESFRHTTTAGQPLLWDGAVGLAPGAGTLRRDASGAIVITAPCRWTIESAAGRIYFHTTQKVGPWHYELERAVELRGRTVVSTSRLTNRAATPLTLEWFAHPFFALQDGRAEVRLPPRTTVPENPGFAMTDSTLVFRRPFVGEFDGHLDHLALPPDQPLTASLSHPRLACVRLGTDFAPFKCVVWANGHTLSLEPFLALNLAPGASRRWRLSYSFGDVIA